MYQRDPRRVAVAGPLARYAEGLCGEVLGRGFTSTSAAGRMQGVAQLSRWLAEHRLGAADLTAEVVERFVVDHAACYRKSLNRRGLDEILDYLRGLVRAEFNIRAGQGRRLGWSSLWGPNTHPHRSYDIRRDGAVGGVRAALNAFT